MENIENANQGASISRDTTMDVSSLLRQSKEEPVRPKSNLEKMREAKENGALGLVVDNNALKEANKPNTISTNKSESDALAEADAYLEEQEKLIKAAQSITIDKQPANAMEMVSLMDSLDAIANNREIETNDGDEQLIHVTTEEERVEQEAVKSQEEIEKDAERARIVEIIIDKTGLGASAIDLTPEEHEKVASSTELRVKEVQEVNLSTIKIRKKTKSFLESVNEFQLSTAKVPVVFPASRFRAEMTGLSYGEMSDISLNSENITFDQVHKKLTVIYNKMVNPSIGKFESFEDFLKKFAYVDIDLAIYGLVVATFPEVDDIPMTCQNPKCKKSFNHKFSPRTLIRFEKSDDKFLDTMKRIVETPAVDAYKLFEESPVNMHAQYQLPYSKFIIEVGIASSYEYLYTIVDNTLGDKFETEHPDDVNGILQLNSTLLGLIRAVYVPEGDEYVLYDEFEDMINALYMIKPEEIAIIAAMLTKFTESYTSYFALTDIKCPHCGTKTEEVPLDVNYLVFHKYQQLMSTEANVANISVL